MNLMLALTGKLKAQHLRHAASGSSSIVDWPELWNKTIKKIYSTQQTNAVHYLYTDGKVGRVFSTLFFQTNTH